MSLTYIVLNLVLQNELESKKMESGNHDITLLLLTRQLLDIRLAYKKARFSLRNLEYDEGNRE